MALDSLLPEERKRLIMSVGTHRGTRPLSPIEVADLVARAMRGGDSLEMIAEAVHLSGTTQLGRFLALRDLPVDVQHMVDWGGGDGTVSFSAAFELSRLHDSEDQRTAVRAVLERELKSSEVRQLVQLRRRGSRPIDECLAAVLRMRPEVEVRHVFIGAVTPGLHQALGGMTQAQRDRVLGDALTSGAEVVAAKGRMGLDKFTLVGGPSLGEAIRARGAEAFEAEINRQLEGVLRHD